LGGGPCPQGALKSYSEVLLNNCINSLASVYGIVSFIVVSDGRQMRPPVNGGQKQICP
jgi:hypothetical protein